MWDFYRFICETNESLESELLEEPFVLACLVPVTENIHCHWLGQYMLMLTVANRILCPVHNKIRLFLHSAFWTEAKVRMLWILWPQCYESNSATTLSGSNLVSQINNICALHTLQNKKYLILYVKFKHLRLNIQFKCNCKIKEFRCIWWQTYLSSNLTLASLLALRFRAGSLKTSLLTTVLSRGMSTEYLRKNDALIRQTNVHN